MKIKNTLFLIAAYSIPCLVATNLFISKNNKQDINEVNLYLTLNRIGYYPTSQNPYQKAIKLELHPTNYFSLPLKSKEKKLIANTVFSLNKNGYRTNPYINNQEGNKKCILFAGSSAAFGIGSTSNKTTITSYTNNKLGSEYNVYNISMPSWNSRQELISIINYHNTNDISNCKTVDTISFTGTTDLLGIESSINNEYYQDIDSRNALFSAPEYFSSLLKNVKDGRLARTDIKYNLKIIFHHIWRLLFGELFDLMTLTMQGHDNKNREEFLKSNKYENFSKDQINSFIINQKLINNLAINQGGNHLVVLQPNLNNSFSNKKSWKYVNNILTESLSKTSCLNILDLRSNLNKLQPKSTKRVSIPLSLKSSIAMGEFDIKDLKNYYYFDNSHLTDYGSFHVSSLIKDSYLNKIKKTICTFSN